MKDDVVAVGAARVRPHGAQGKMETLGARVPLDGDRAALSCAIAQHQLTVIIQPHLWEDAQVRRHIWRARQQSQHAGILNFFYQTSEKGQVCRLQNSTNLQQTGNVLIDLRWTDFHTRSAIIILQISFFTDDPACTWQCTWEVEDTLVELTDGTPVIKEHLYHLPPSYWLR